MRQKLNTRQQSQGAAPPLVCVEKPATGWEIVGQDINQKWQEN